MKDDIKLALQVDERDNVATVFALGVCIGDEVEVRDHTGRVQRICTRADIPYGHKIALVNIPESGHIIKYGEVIGTASTPICKGDYVHVHNMKALRGRGDL